MLVLLSLMLFGCSKDYKDVVFEQEDSVKLDAQIEEMKNIAKLNDYKLVVPNRSVKLMRNHAIYFPVLINNINTEHLEYNVDISSEDAVLEVVNIPQELTYGSGNNQFLVNSLSGLLNYGDVKVEPVGVVASNYSGSYEFNIIVVHTKSREIYANKSMVLDVY